MKEELAKLIRAERKHERELYELRELRRKIMQHKNPDKGIVEQIDNEIKIYLTPK